MQLKQTGQSVVHDPNLGRCQASTRAALPWRCQQLGTGPDHLRAQAGEREEDQLAPLAVQRDRKDVEAGGLCPD